MGESKAGEASAGAQGESGTGQSPAPSQDKLRGETSAPAGIVGIGASAGGLEALKVFLSQLPADTPFACVVAQHLSPVHDSMLAPLLARDTPLRVQTIVQGQRMERGHVYVTPPGCNVRVDEHGRLELSESVDSRLPKPAIDGLFSSLADRFGSRAVGVVLSGTGSDGARGIRAIRAAGGATFAQDDRTARYSGMPRAAVDTGCVDHVMSPDQLAKELGKLACSAGDPAPDTGRSPDGPAMDRIYALVRSRTGSNLEDYKDATVQRRLRRRMAATSSKSLEAYETHLRDQAEEVDRLAQEVLIGVTSFFRDSEAFEALARCVRETIAGKEAQDELRIWVSGCATGEEAYSVAMLVADAMDRAGRQLQVKIFATDIDSQAIARARQGWFPVAACLPDPHPLMLRFCTRTGHHYQVEKRIREMIVFSLHDLTRDPAFLRLDLITCRNVLIYLRPRVQSRILRTFAFALQDRGILFLGKSEAPHVEPALFEVLDEHARLYRRSAAAAPKAPPAPGRSRSPMPAVTAAIRRERRQTPSLGDRLMGAMQGTWLHAAVVVDENLDIQHIIGDVSPYLRMPQGTPALNVAALATDALSTEIRTAVFRARRCEGGPVTHIVPHAAFATPLSLGVLPIPAEPGLPALFAVRFEPLDSGPAHVAASASPDTQVLALERQLAATREHLRTVIQELEAANEDLQVLNDELSSGNQELETANEELATANEELQSTNEELTTVNEELEAKTQELTLLNNDLRNLKDGIELPLVVVDEFQRVSFYNPAAREIFDFSPASTGQLLLSIPCKVEVTQLAGALRSLSETRLPVTFEVGEDRTYSVHVRPYLDDRQQQRGALITFMDVTEAHARECALRDSHARMTVAERFAHATLDALPEHICVVDQQGKIVSVNAAWRRYAESNPGGTAVQSVGANYVEVCRRAIAAGDTVAAAFLQGLEAVMHGDSEEFCFEYPCHSPTERRWFEARVSAFPGEGPRFFVISHEDVTQRHLNEDKLLLQSSALDWSVNGVVIADAQSPDLPIVYANRAFETLTGYSAQAVIGSNCRFLQGTDRDQPALNVIRDCLRNFKSGRVLLRNYRKDGTLFWNELYLYPLPGKDGRPAYMVGIQTDKTALLASEMALRESADRERRTLAFAGVGTFEWDIRTGQITSSDANLHLFGLDRHEPVSYSVLCTRLHEEDRSHWDDAVRVCIAGHDSLDVEVRVIWPDATLRWVHVRGSIEHDESGGTSRMLCLSQDITERRAAEERVRFIAQHDVLTGLPNRNLLRDRLQRALLSARRKRERVAVLFIDLDRFKDVNDSLGHDTGDQLLVSVAHRLQGCIRESDTVCRQGGDEYIVVLPEIRDSNEAAHVAIKIIEALSLPHNVDGRELTVTPSIGVSIFPDDGDDIDTLVRNADSAMYHAKGNGRRNFQFFTQEMNERAMLKLAVATDLREAVLKDALVVHYQPQFSVTDSRVVGMEALVRWPHPQRGLLMPGQFIAIAEESDVILHVGNWVLREVCRQQRRWQDAGYACVPVAVNVSPAQFRTPAFIEQVSGALCEYGVAPSLLELEVTESMVMENPQETSRIIAAIQGLGVRVAIDDFGTGHSSLAQLRRFRVQALKIDRAFVQDVPGDPDAAAIVRAIISLAHSMGLETIAEGVEDPLQLAFLREQGCSSYQGFLGSRPVPADQVPDLVQALAAGEAVA